MANGRVVFLEVIDGGAGYVAPLTVTVAPAARTRHPISIGSPDGLMRLSIAHMALSAAPAAPSPAL